ncbi:hypothetical protein GCM10023224_15640 [Streptomonospora halophila]|uniref:SnoaL-like domain-containing protein n=1 Tax=Streptomonospora halophila TaxID=427369 RepID=A0ABP9GAM5_9ACTN
MSTRGAIALPTQQGSWWGRYHHTDSYPAGLGRELYRLYHHTFDCDHTAMAQTLIADHPAGWSCLLYSGADAHGPFTRAEFDLSGFVSATSPIRGHYPACYCHGQRSEGAQLLECRCPHEPSGCGPAGIEWAYVLTAEEMWVVTSHIPDQPVQGPVHRFVDRVLWDEPEPDWRRVEQAVRTGARPVGDDAGSPIRRASSD